MIKFLNIIHYLGDSYFELHTKFPILFISALCYTLCYKNPRYIMRILFLVK